MLKPDSLKDKFEQQLRKMGSKKTIRRVVRIKDSISRDQLTRSHYIINDESVKKRNKNMFGGIMSYLKKAKTTLENDEGKLKLQRENYDRIDQRQEEESKEIREKQRAEIEEKREAELKKKKEIELELIRVDQEVLLKKLDLMYTQMGEYILTKTQPPLFWKPNKSRDDISKLLEESKTRVESMKQKHMETTTDILAKVKEEYLSFVNRKSEGEEEKVEIEDEKNEEVSDTESSQEIKKESDEGDSKAEDQ